MAHGHECLNPPTHSGWCGLCGFYLLGGEETYSVPAVDPDGYGFTPMPGTPYVDANMAILSHLECTKAHSEPVDEDAIRDSYQASSFDQVITHTEERARAHLLWSKMDECFSRPLPVSIYGPKFVSALLGLPAEIRHQIAGYLLRIYATVNAKTLLGPKKQTDMKFKLSRNVWASFVKFEDVTYVRTLSNKKKRKSDVLVWRPRDGNVSIGHDARGIRALKFRRMGTTMTFDESLGLWWSSQYLRKNMVVIATSDGIKLRDFIVDMARPGPISWHSVADQHVRMRKATTSFYRSNRTTRMHSVILNDPEVRGYSACWLDNTLMGFYPQRQGDLGCYDKILPDDCLWVYMPLLEGEWITAVWLCRRKPPEDCYSPIPTRFRSTIVLHTSQRRTLVMGRYPNVGRHPTGYSSTFINVVPNKPTQAFVGCHQNGTHFGIEGVNHELDKLHGTLTVPPPLSGYPPSLPEVDHYFYSSATMSNIVSFVPCLERRGQGFYIIGLCFTYRCGAKATLGQFRWDSCCRPVEVASQRADSLWLSFNVSDPTMPYVCNVDVNPPKGPQMFLFRVPLYGTLQWWFTRDTAICHYHGRNSPVPRRPSPENEPEPTDIIPQPGSHELHVIPAIPY